MRLSLDFGTSNTVGVLHRLDGSVTTLLFDSSPLLPSSVHIGPDGAVLTGADADRAAPGFPAGLEPHPKRRIDDGTVWLGEREVPVVDLIAAVLARVLAEAHRVGGRPPVDVVLTHPAAWGATRLQVLTDAAVRAGLPPVRFVPEPVAAAAYFASVLGREIPDGRALIVYDLGAGTFDVSVVRRGPGGFEVIATGGLNDVGGLDLDATLVEHARSHSGGAADAWSRLDWPETAADQRARRVLWQDARAAKETLSRHARADLHVPLAEADLHVTREEFEKAARAPLDRTVAATLDLLRAANVTRERMAGVLLVGGSSRIPQVGTLLHRRLGVPPTVIDQPELVVALGGSAAAGALSVVPSPALEFDLPAPEPEHVPEPGIGITPRPPLPLSARMPAVGGIPARGVVPPDFPVHLIEVAIGNAVGYAVRTYVRDARDEWEAVFASEDGRLPLFPRPERAADDAAGGEQHTMTRVLHWEAMAESMANAFLPLAKERRYRLDLPPVTLARDPKDWLLDVVVDAGDLARELVHALEIEEAYELVEPGSMLDVLDDALRVARRSMFRRQARRDLDVFDRRLIVADWRRVTRLIEARVDWRS
ncbi:Hsp70 family protein [Catenuloplanes japonicus]|uniref:Hsp70 family protein n=1 Tax=Catenuloplanes japonicus TaxID=33876 RepID=UPI000691A4C4|nr:Hsp70 family protein [Catenuloplanes japonicus]